MPPPGAETSLQTDLFRPAELTSATSVTSAPPTLPDRDNGTSSQASPVGRMPAASPSSRMPSPSGPDHVHVSRFRSLDAGEAMPTSATSGPLFSASSPSADLQLSLESRLRALLDVNGSPEFVLTWKAQDMPAGVPICRLAASARRTSGLGCSGAVSGWGTPCANPAGSTPERFLQRKRDSVARGHSMGICLTDLALQMTAWATPTARDWRSGEASEATHARNARPLNEQMVAAWSTPRASDGEKGGPNQSFGAGGQPLPAQMAHSGQTLSGSPATTASRGVPNPAFPSWLMGYPAEWLWNAPAKAPRPRFKKRARSAASPLGAGSGTR